jgi:hypothetical protein
MTNPLGIENGLYFPRIEAQKGSNGPATDISVPPSPETPKKALENLVGISSGIFEIVTIDEKSHFLDLDSEIFTFPDGRLYLYSRVDGPQVGAPMVVKWMEHPLDRGCWERTLPVKSITPAKHLR